MPKIWPYRLIAVHYKLPCCFAFLPQQTQVALQLIFVAQARIIHSQTDGITLPVKVLLQC